MFIKTFENTIKDELIDNGFKFICEQDFGISKCYIFELKPSLYEIFNQDDMQSIFVSSEIFI